MSKIKSARITLLDAIEAEDSDLIRRRVTEDIDYATLGMTSRVVGSLGLPFPSLLKISTSISSQGRLRFVTAKTPLPGWALWLVVRRRLPHAKRALKRREHSPTMVKRACDCVSRASITTHLASFGGVFTGRGRFRASR